MKGTADIFAARGDVWNARNPQVHAGRAFRRRSAFHGGGREPHDEIEGYDDPAGGPRAAIRKRAFDEPLGRVPDPEARLRCNRVREALSRVR